MTFADSLRGVLKYWYVIVAGLLIGAVAGLLTATLQEASYSSTVRLGIAPSSSAAGSTQTQIISALNNTAVPATLVQVASSASIEAAAASDAKVSSAGVSVNAVVANNSNVVEVTVTAHNQQVPQALANSVIKVASARFTQIYPIATVIVVQTATRAVDSRTSTALTIALVAVVGLVVGFLIVLAIVSAAAGRGRREATGDEIEAPAQPAHANRSRRSRHELHDDIEL